MAAAAESTLAVRWRTVTEDWLAARAEYISQLESQVTDVSALRKAAQRLYDLQQLRVVLTQELEELPQ